MKTVKLSTHLYSHELTCNCGNCRYSDPMLIPHIVDRDLIDKFEELRLILKVPIVVNRGVSCLEYHKNIYKNIYKDTWQQHITWSSKHLPHKITENDHTIEKFYAMDVKPLTNNYDRIKIICGYLRFHGIGHYSKTLVDGTYIEDHFLHLDTGLPLLRYFRKHYAG